MGKQKNGKASSVKTLGEIKTETTKTEQVSPSGNNGWKQYAFATVLIAIISAVLHQVLLKKDNVTCQDLNPGCKFWSESGECELNPSYMTQTCPVSCNICTSTLAVPKTVTEAASREEPASSQESPDSANGSCQDKHENCAFWAEEGECKTNPGYMLDNCAKSCKSCDRQHSRADDEDAKKEEEEVVVEEEEEEVVILDDKYLSDDDEIPYDDDEAETPTPRVIDKLVVEDDDDPEEVAEDDTCIDKDGECEAFAKQGECEANPRWMLQNCCKSCGGVADDTDCSDSNSDCAFWAQEGECEANPGYMLTNCQKSCKVCTESGKCKDLYDSKECRSLKLRGDCESVPGWMTVYCGKTCGKCELMDAKVRCDPARMERDVAGYEYKNAYEPGDMNAMFESHASDPNVEVILRPPQGPWVLRFKKFVTKEEGDRLLNYTLPNVKRSTDQGEVDEFGIQEQVVSSGRTSSNAWCLEDCTKDEIVANLTKRISNIVKVPIKNFESYQVLQYKLGEKYDVHHDSSDRDKLELAGPRILTFFIYLSDVDEGGETFFDQLNIRVKPEQGSAILWPSTINEIVDEVDARTTHAALPVIKGVKLAANTWIHLRDFVTPNHHGCTGAFDMPTT